MRKIDRILIMSNWIDNVKEMLEVKLNRKIKLLTLACFSYYYKIFNCFKI